MHSCTLPCEEYGSALLSVSLYAPLLHTLYACLACTPCTHALYSHPFNAAVHPEYVPLLSVTLTARTPWQYNPVYLTLEKVQLNYFGTASLHSPECAVLHTGLFLCLSVSVY